ncbi:glycosyltransferase family 4 protein [Rhodocytophaga aerolata]|uniref:Glycosyltransferase family 4 protein n=1 Tax=Rhodocytophaga aerolata TaxID=455078 RepID=A0ABT8R0F6_9BACT|nr:glycosyltransferase family 4 protein [Rhodocytophaga aerolata]MDO1444894.1 glycosyltransferase family 4 protein [Rhodocytophaga aerolata]
MKVLFMFGGLPHYYNLVLNRLNQVPGLEVVVVAPSNQSKNVGAGVHQTLEGIDFKVHFLEEYQTVYGKTFFKNFSQLIRQENPDVIVTIWPYVVGFVYNIPLLALIKSKGIKLILKEIPFKIPKYQEARQFYAEGGIVTEDLKTNLNRNSLLFRLKYDLVTYVRKIYYNLMDAHVNYIEEAYDIIGSYGVDKRKIFITYNSPDTDIIYAAKEKIKDLPPILPPNPHRLLHVGRLIKWKRVDMLIEVFSRLTDEYPDAELVIVGNGPEEATLKNQVQALGLSQSVHFTGAIYDTETLGRYFTAAAVYVLAGLGGLSINEAMTFEKPIVCSECDGTEKKLVREGYNGKYFKEGDADSLYQVLQELLANPQQLAQMGKRSEEIIRNEVNIHTVIKGYVAAFNFVTNHKYHLQYTPTATTEKVNKL